MNKREVDDIAYQIARFESGIEEHGDVGLTEYTANSAIDFVDWFLGEYPAVKAEYEVWIESMRESRKKPYC